MILKEKNMEIQEQEQLANEAVDAARYALAKRAYIHPIKLLRYERKMVFILDKIYKKKEKIDINIDHADQNNENKIISENLHRLIVYLETRLRINSHNFLIISAFLSIFISLILGLTSVILGIISICK